MNYCYAFLVAYSLSDCEEAGNDLEQFFAPRFLFDWMSFSAAKQQKAHHGTHCQEAWWVLLLFIAAI
jgi:hypothetical protein